MKRFYRVFSLFLALMLCVSLLPVGAAALEVSGLDVLQSVVDAVAEAELPEPTVSETEEQTEEDVTEEPMQAEALLSKACEHSVFIYVEPYYTACGGGLTEGYYNCVDCDWVWDEDGNELPYDFWDIYYEEGTGKHTAGRYVTPDWTACGGGLTEGYYLCKNCGRDCDADGNELNWEEFWNEYYVEGTGEHTVGRYIEPDYTECGGGLTEGYYLCRVCRMDCDIDGNELSEEFWDDYYVRGTGEHKAGEFREPDWTVCGGGLTEGYYYCEICEFMCDAEGNVLGEGFWAKYYKEGNGAHTPGEESYKANYTECMGGYTINYHFCTVCEVACDKDGNEAWEYYEFGNGHDYADNVCTICGGPFGDLNGDGKLDPADLILLMKAVVSNRGDMINDPDLNEDGDIDILDVIRLIRIMSEPV